MTFIDVESAVIAPRACALSLGLAAEVADRVLIIEDQDADTQNAITIFHKLGLEIQSKITVRAACSLLEEIAEGEHPAPHLIVLDLGFLYESGFEVLR